MMASHDGIEGDGPSFCSLLSASGMKSVVLVCIATICYTAPAYAFMQPSFGLSPSSSMMQQKRATRFKIGSAADPVEAVDIQDEFVTQLKQLSLEELKTQLIDFLPSMTGTAEEFRRVEEMVNDLESRYMPAQTLEFLNLLMQGEWQLLFSTNLAGTPNPAKFRLRELFQRVTCKGREGTIDNEATWDLAEDGDAVFDATGSFVVKCEYEINQGARMLVDLKDHLLLPARGSKIPADVEGLVGLLYRAMPSELFDPANHAVDTTYLDGDLRIVRYTGPRLEAVRDIFIRRGQLTIDPTASSTSTSKKMDGSSNTSRGFGKSS